jgi:putative ABC transport system substrate-binding protein
VRGKQLRRRDFIALLASAAALPPGALAQQSANVRRAGWLSPGSRISDDKFLAAFQEGLRELGWTAGKNVGIEPRWAEGRFERLPALAAELVQLKVDVIVANVTQASLAARNATRTIPIVMVGVGDPLGSGLVDNLAHPGGNITGPSSMLAEASVKQLALLRETVPNAPLVAVLRNPANPVWQASALRETQATARAMALQLQFVEARGPDDLERAFAAMTKERAGALFVPADIIFVRHARELAELAAKHRLPAMFGFREHVEAGGLMSYAASFAVMFKRAAAFVDKILKGAKPGDLPVEQPTKFELVINMKTAKALGLTIPQSVLVRADEMIQ